MARILSVSRATRLGVNAPPIARRSARWVGPSDTIIILPAAARAARAALAAPEPSCMPFSEEKEAVSRSTACTCGWRVTIQ